MKKLILLGTIIVSLALKGRRDVFESCSRR